MVDRQRVRMHDNLFHDQPDDLLSFQHPEGLGRVAQRRQEVLQRALQLNQTALLHRLQRRALQLAFQGGLPASELGHALAQLR